MNELSASEGKRSGDVICSDDWGCSEGESAESIGKIIEAAQRKGRGRRGRRNNIIIIVID